MAAGKTVVMVRLSDELLSDVKESVASCTSRGRDVWTVSEWVRKAIYERLDKLKRSRQKMGKKYTCTCCMKRVELSDVHHVVGQEGKRNCTCLRCASLRQGELAI